MRQGNGLLLEPKMSSEVVKRSPGASEACESIGIFAGETRDAKTSLPPLHVGEERVGGYVKTGCSRRLGAEV